MFAYGYDEQHYYSGEVYRQENPMEPGTWLMPARATEIPPPAIPEGYRAKFTEAGWILEEKPKENPEPFLPTEDFVESPIQDPTEPPAEGQ
jgi:hypothetical protein